MQDYTFNHERNIFRHIEFQNLKDEVIPQLKYSEKYKRFMSGILDSTQCGPIVSYIANIVDNHFIKLVPKYTISLCTCGKDWMPQISKPEMDRIVIVSFGNDRVFKLTNDIDGTKIEIKAGHGDLFTFNKKLESDYSLSLTKSVGLRYESIYLVFQKV